MRVPGFVVLGFGFRFGVWGFAIAFWGFGFGVLRLWGSLQGYMAPLDPAP